MTRAGSELVEAEAWIAGRIEKRAGRSGRREVLIRCDVEEGLRLSVSAGLARAIDGLLDFALASVPDGCEVRLEASRPLEVVAALGAGRLALRWQTSGPRDPGAGAEKITPIRPLPGDAGAHLRSDRMLRIREAFASAGWRVEIESIASGGELLVRALSP